MDDLQLEFVRSLWEERCLSPATVVTARALLGQLQRWLLDQGLHWRRVDHCVINEYLRQAQQRYAANTFELQVWAMRIFFHWAVEQGYADPGLSIQRLLKTIFRTATVPKFIPSIRAVERLLELPDVSTPKGLRDRAMLELLYGAGLRASELLSLNVYEVDLCNRCGQVLGKGNKQRLFVLGEIACHWVRLYLHEARTEILNRGGYGSHSTNLLFVHAAGAPGMHYRTFLRMIRHYGKRADMELLTPHSLRHAFASHLYKQGANLAAIQQLLGHADLATTTIYVSPTTERFFELIERHHPRGHRYVRFERLR